MQRFTPALAYFLIVFGAGFLLGTIRVLLILPVLGERVAELLEMPFMLIFIVLAARWIDRRFLMGEDDRGRIVVGVLATALVLSAEFILGIALRGMTPRDVLFARDPVSGAAYYLSLLLFAVMPWLIAPRRRR